MRSNITICCSRSVVVLITLFIHDGKRMQIDSDPPSSFLDLRVRNMQSKAHQPCLQNQFKAV